MERKGGIIKAEFLSRKRKEIGIISVLAIIISSFSLFFYQQNITEQNIKDSIFNQYKDRQIETTQIISERIESDLKLIMSILQGIADSVPLQQGELYGDKIQKIMKEKFDQINNITKVDGLFIADEDNIITYNIVSEGKRSFVNIDISFRDYVQETRNSLRPTFSNGFKGIDNMFSIALTVPIVNSDSGKYIGIIGIQIPTEPFFAHSGNINNVDSQFLVAYDSKKDYLATPRTQFIGKNFFDNNVQKFFNVTDIQNNYYHKVFSGKLLGGSAVYDFGSGERLNTGHPILLQERPTYFIFVITPTTQIYSHIDDILHTERVKGFSLIFGLSFAVLILIIFLIKWNNTLNIEVRKRTKELQESNRQLSLSNQEIALANEELKVHDKMQKEFINIASHEIKTPLQAILSASQLLQMYPERQKKFASAIQRNAIRLQRLSNDILDVAKIESRSLKLNKELFDLNELISNIVEDYKTIIIKDNHSVKLYFKPSNYALFVEADKERIAGVISNLLSNAIKFTKKGEIFVSIRKENSKSINPFALVTVKDNGEGIDPEILPKIFSKFITKSYEGLGLGMYISKNIVEAHEGKIWTENKNNNKNGNPGAIFYFTLPLSKGVGTSNNNIDK
ncbi:MAG TPA: ATP-binding protein [Nitrososphaeraceae archaeon]|nr:ATP-binding protein [Nitrososphaeraceae archaeon]